MQIAYGQENSEHLTVKLELGPHRLLGCFGQPVLQYSKCLHRVGRVHCLLQRQVHIGLSQQRQCVIDDRPPLGKRERACRRNEFRKSIALPR